MWGVEMLLFLSNLFDTTVFPSLWYCGSRWAQEPIVGWIHVVLDVLIFLSYMAIPLTLLYYTYRKKTGMFLPVFWLFAAFILACGFVHLVEATIFWHPWYRLSGMLKVTTALVSMATVGALVPQMPKFLSLRTPEELEYEIAERKSAEAEAGKANRAKVEFLTNMSHTPEKQARMFELRTQSSRKRDTSLHQGFLDSVCPPTPVAFRGKQPTG